MTTAIRLLTKSLELVHKFSDLEPNTWFTIKCEENQNSQRRIYFKGQGGSCIEYGRNMNNPYSWCPSDETFFEPLIILRDVQIETIIKATILEP